MTLEELLRPMGKCKEFMNQFSSKEYALTKKAFGKLKENGMFSDGPYLFKPEKVEGVTDITPVQEYGQLKNGTLVYCFEDGIFNRSVLIGKSLKAAFIKDLKTKRNEFEDEFKNLDFGEYVKLFLLFCKEEKLI